MGEEGVLEPLPRVFYILQYFEKNYPQWKAFELRNSRKDEVYIMGGGATGDLCSHQKW